MNFAFILIAALTLGGAIAAMSLRNLVHCALCMVATFGGIALMYLNLNAEFVGFAQLLVYVGAVAILIVFAVLLTRSDAEKPVRFVSGSAIASVGVVALVAICLITAIQHTTILPTTSPAIEPAAPVKQIGEQLMTNYVLPLEVIGLLLTAAMIGAVVISMREPETTEAAGFIRPGKRANRLSESSVDVTRRTNVAAPKQ
jgi:NADH-quinone oxidoreductase subunit J